MSVARKVAAKLNRRPAKVGATYRGVRVQPIGGRSRFTRDQITKAVETAIAKNPDEFARET